ncbi:hypothetical protein [Tsukamurella pseudospumae]|uniref:hypothetical protein n=1 Tax=Tsukamurella pseudospumae TaxID=239498 RepID=UPI001112912D|nr:hypothetical protein [Tsukamurella pseudospumae]
MDAWIVSGDDRYPIFGNTRLTVVGCIAGIGASIGAVGLLFDELLVLLVSFFFSFAVLVIAGYLFPIGWLAGAIDSPEYGIGREAALFGLIATLVCAVASRGVAAVGVRIEELSDDGGQ